MQIHKGIEMHDLGIYLAKHNALIFSDFHLGFEETLNTRGSLVPRFQFKDTITLLDKICANIQQPIETIILNGDIKHEFGTITTQEWREVLKLIDFLLTKCKKIIIVKGNHDMTLSVIAKKRNMCIVKNLRMGDILIAHGDSIDKEALEKTVKTIIIGHDHPAFAVRDNRRVELFKCYLKGTWKRKTLIVQPSFNTVREGTDVLQGRFLSPYLGQQIDNFEVWVVADQTRYFGRVKDNQ